MSRRLTWAVCMLAWLTASGCAHRWGDGASGPAEPSRRLQAEAASVGDIRYEDDFVEARFVFQALPLEAAERAALRGKLVTYLLGPVVRLEADKLRAEVRETGADDIY